MIPVEVADIATLICPDWADTNDKITFNEVLNSAPGGDKCRYKPWPQEAIDQIMIDLTEDPLREDVE